MLMSPINTNSQSSSQRGDEIGSDVELRQRVSFLAATVDKQREIISKLSAQVRFVLSFLDIADADCPPELALSPSQWPILSAAEQGGHPITRDDTNVDPTTNDTHARSSDIHARSTKSSFRGAVLSAVYSDMRDKEIRAKNFVISGLPASTDIEDKAVVEGLCEEELGVKPVIKSCRRLGKTMPGKVRPLKVTVRTAEQAISVIAAARNLAIVAVNLFP